MRKVLPVVGGIFLVIVILGLIGGGCVWLRHAWLQGDKLDAESKAYVESILPPLLSNFSSDNFIKYVADENKSKIDRASIDKLAPELQSHWGAFKSYDSLKGDSIVSVTPDGEQIFARYVATAHYEKDTGSLEIILIKTNDAWSLASINFRTDGTYTTGTAQSLNVIQNLSR